MTRRGRHIRPTDQMMIGQAAALVVRSEQLQAAVCRNDITLDDECLTRNIALLSRLLDRLGIVNNSPMHEPDTTCTPMSAHTRGDDESDANSSTKTTPTAV